MPATVPCVPCCPTPQIVNVPGVEGIPGSDGLNGINAFTLTTADFVIPAVANPVTVALISSLWMAIGQIVVADGPATFQVTSLPDDVSAVLTFLGYPGDLAAGVTISAGAKVSPAGVLSILTTPLSVYASGTAYPLTNSSQLLDFTGGGSVDPSLTITSAGTYLLLSRVRYDFNGKTVNDGRIITTKLRRTNNTAADIADSSTNFVCRANTTGNGTAGVIELQPIIYTTVNSDDVLELWGSLSAVDVASNILAQEASIVAVKLF